MGEQLVQSLTESTEVSCLSCLTNENARFVDHAVLLQHLCGDSSVMCDVFNEVSSLDSKIYSSLAI